MDPESHSRAQELFEQAEALSPDERETFLRTIGSDDPTLRHEVARLLKAAAEMDEDFLEPPGVPRVEKIRAGESLAHYRILEPLGAGGMGEVYLAEDERLKRRVALKVLPPELAGNQERLERFQREAETVAALNHPNIVTIYSIEKARGLHFLTMELVEGPSLRQLLDQSGALPVEDVLHLAIQICEGLAEAHAAGIVHRDLKPGNVMVAPNDRVKVLDFGLARPDRPLEAEAARADAKAPLTRDGAIIGTVAYMSPEQLTGRRVDSRSDVFSLGILLFEVATGKHPFPATAETSKLAKILEREPESLLGARPGLPKELERIVGRCLEKDPAKRYQDTAQLVRELRALRGGGVSAGHTAHELPGYRRSQLFSRRRVLAAIAAVSIAFGAIALWQRIQPEPRPPVTREILSVAVLPLRNIGEDPEETDYLAEGIGQAVATKLTQAGLRVAPWESVRRVQADLPLKEIAKELGVAAVLVGSFQLANDRIRTTLSLVEAGSGHQTWAHDFDEPFEDIFAIQNQIAVKAAQSLKGRLTPEEQESLTAPATNNLDAYDLYLQGAHYLQAQDEESTELARRYFEQALEIDPELVDAHIGRGAAYSMRYFNSWGGVEDLGAAEESHLTALQLDPVSMRARRGLIRVEADRGQSEEVLILARDARRLGRPNEVESLLAEAEGYALGGLAELSLPIFRRILELDPLNATAAWWLVMAGAWAGEFEAAVQAGEAFASKFGDDPMVHTWVGNSYYSLGRLDRADTHYQQAIAGPTDVASLGALLFRGHLQEETGRQDEALSTWKSGLDAVRGRLDQVPDSPRLHWFGATFETCLSGPPSNEVLRPLLGEIALSADSYFLAAALAKRGDWQRSVESLRWMLDRGTVASIWENYFRGLGVDPDSSELVEFRQAYERRRADLKERFGPADPVERVSAR